MLHPCISCGSPSHAMPPCLSGWSISRLLPCIPPPHVLVQISHSPQGPHSQLTRIFIQKPLTYKKWIFIIWYLHDHRNVEKTYLDIFVCCNLGIGLALLRILLRHLQQPVIHLLYGFGFRHHMVMYIQTMRAREPICSFLLWFDILNAWVQNM